MSKAHLGFQVREHNPWRLWLGIALVLLFLVVMFLLGRAYQGYELSQLKLVKATLEANIEELELRNSSLVTKNAQLESASRIEHDAYVKANDSLVSLQKEILALKEELVFYQGIVSPEQLALGINIQSFELSEKNTKGLYHYKLVLTKRGKSNSVVKGDIDFQVKGLQQGASKQLSLENLKADFSKNDVKFGFRYFQIFEGELAIPEKFEPEDIELVIKPTTRKIKNFSETISWVQAVAGGDI